MISTVVIKHQKYQSHKGDNFHAYKFIEAHLEVKDVVTDILFVLAWSRVLVVKIHTYYYSCDKNMPVNLGPSSAMHARKN